MMAAIAAAGRGAQVTLIEPNERLGKKLNITGKDAATSPTTVQKRNSCETSHVMENSFTVLFPPLIAKMPWPFLRSWVFP